MEYIAHQTEDGQEQSLKEHLENTAFLCRDNAAEPFKEYAYLCGQIHDIGKYQPSWQKYILGEMPRGTNHAYCGAKEIKKNGTGDKRDLAMLQFCIASHHTGLMDGGQRTDSSDSLTLRGTLKRESEDYSAYMDELDIKYPEKSLSAFYEGLKKKEEIELFAFFTRYLFSCLTDADYLDTESFCSPDTDRKFTGDFDEALNRLRKKIDSFKAETKLQKARGKIQSQVYESIKEQKRIYAIDMPTGSGKTLCSMRAALEIAKAQNKKRIIYVIPFVSVIEQTADTFEGIFSDALPVLQHHSNYDFDKNYETDIESTADKLKKVCENWDAPLIVTTNVQFFESIYRNKSSRLRKLHNMADSVIVFDEVHMLPSAYIQPCIRAIGYLTKYLNSTAIIMSATMPDFSKYLKEYVSDADITYAVKDKSDYELFRNCRYEYMGKVTLEVLAERLISEENALAVVNTKKEARELYRLCSTSGIWCRHLSTNQTAEDRSAIIKEIRERLAKGERTLVISTSLIEAGVDLDFKTVYRENAGLDNVLQAGGRCNREGKEKTGYVRVFETDNTHRELAVKASMTRSLFKEYDDISDKNCIKEYYERLFMDNDHKIMENSIVSYMGESKKPESVPFRTYAEKFTIIKDDTVGVIIPNDENSKLIEELRHGKNSVKRKLQRHTVSVNEQGLKEMAETGILEVVSGAYVLSNPDYYNKEVGLNIKEEQNYIF